MITPTERGDLAERLLPVAARLACVVHGDGDHHDVAQVLCQLDPAERDALIVVLAGLVDPRRSVADALGWVTWDEHGLPVPGTNASASLQALAAVLPGPEPAAPALPAGWTPRLAVIVEDTAELAAQGLSREAIAGRLGVPWNTITQYHLRVGARLPEVKTLRAGRVAS